METSVTVVIATHSRRAMLAEAVESVRAQSHPAQQLIVVDDGSTDDTPDWCARELRKPGEQWIRHAQPQERCRARNAGLAAASGAWIQFLDDDDRLRPRALESLVRAATRSPGAVAAVGGRWNWHQGVAGRDTADHVAQRRAPRWIWRELLWGWSAVSGQNLYQTALVREIGGYDFPPPCEDRDLWLRVAGRGPVALTSALTVDYRWHRAQVPKDRQLESLRQQAFARFIAGLPVEQRPTAERMLAARARHLRARQLAAAGHWRRGLGELAAMARREPWLWTSPVTGPALRRETVRFLRRALLP
jgi:glycosyltransferase involved in cell wall biosynthesis